MFFLFSLTKIRNYFESLRAFPQKVSKFSDIKPILSIIIVKMSHFNSFKGRIVFKLSRNVITLHRFKVWNKC